jgi:hypothetical protein
MTKVLIDCGNSVCMSPTFNICTAKQISPQGNVNDTRLTHALAFVVQIDGSECIYDLPENARPQMLRV